MTLDAGHESTNVPIAYITKFLMSLFFSIASIAYIIVEYWHNDKELINLRLPQSTTMDTTYSLHELLLKVEPTLGNLDYEMKRALTNISIQHLSKTLLVGRGTLLQDSTLTNSKQIAWQLDLRLLN